MTAVQKKKFDYYQQILRKQVKRAQKSASISDLVGISILKRHYRQDPPIDGRQQSSGIPTAPEPKKLYSDLQVNAVRITLKVVINNRATRQTLDIQMLDSRSNAYIINNPTRCAFVVESILLDIEIYAGAGTIKAVARGRAQLQVRSIVGSLSIYT